MTDRERRRHERASLHAYAALATRGLDANDQAFGVVVDVSRSGVGLRTGQPPHPGQAVVLRLGIGEDIRTIEARVARVSARGQGVYEVGLEWSQREPEFLAFLDEILAAPLWPPS